MGVWQPKPTNIPSGEEEPVAKGRTSDAVDGTRVPVVGLEVLLVVADGTLVDQPVLGAGEVRRPIPGGEVKRQAAGLPRNHALRVACRRERGPLGSSVLGDCTYTKLHAAREQLVMRDMASDTLFWRQNLSSPRKGVPVQMA